MPQDNGTPVPSKNNPKLELIINNPKGGQTPPPGETTINLMNIFANMKKSARLYLRIACLFLLVGILVPLLMSQFSNPRLQAIALLSFNEGNGDTAPDGTELDTSLIRSSYVIGNALQSVSLSKNLTFSMVASNITIDRILTSKSRQNIEYINSLKDDYTGTALSDLWKSVDIKYSNQYVVTLKNGFSSDPDSKKVYVKDSELKELLTSIMNAYSAYFFETYADYKLPGNILETVDLDKLEYITILDHLNDSADSLVSYCNAKNAAYPGYRSPSDGLSFADLASAANFISDIDVNYCYSFLYDNNIARSVNTLLTEYNYKLRLEKLKLTETEHNIETVVKAIEVYQRDKVVVSPVIDQAGTVVSQSTDYYNGLINSQLQLNAEKHSIEKNISDLELRISSLASSPAPSAKIDALDTRIRQAYKNLQSLYTTVCDHATELFDEGYVRNGYMTVAYTSSDGTSNSDSITTIGKTVAEGGRLKKIAMGAVIGVALAVCVWGVDALITELKSGNGKERETA